MFLLLGSNGEFLFLHEGVVVGGRRIDDLLQFDLAELRGSAEVGIEIHIIGQRRFARFVQRQAVAFAHLRPIGKMRKWFDPLR